MVSAREPSSDRGGSQALVRRPRGQVVDPDRPGGAVGDIGSERRPAQQQRGGEAGSQADSVTRPRVVCNGWGVFQGRSLLLLD